MAELQVHPAADAFPMMDKERFNELKEDISKHGQQEPITICDGLILDGRNRYKAVKELALTPKTRTFTGDPWAYVWSLNGERRDLVGEQRYLIWKFCHEQSEVFQAEKRRIAEEANKKRSVAAKDKERKPDGTFQPVVEQSVHPLVKEAKERKAKAEKSKTNAGAVSRGDNLAKERPDLADKVRKGELKPTEAHRQMKRDEVKEKAPQIPDGKYTVIYADPPWQYNDSRAFGEYANTAADNHYPTMPTSDICALEIGKLADTNCVLFCWATFPMLTDALAVVKAWGFKYKTAFVWAKGRANFGNYHKADAELLLVATRGSRTPETDVRESQVQEVKREGRHSEKPEHFRVLIERLYPSGKKIELFRRGDAIKGWEVWGNEC